MTDPKDDDRPRPGPGWLGKLVMWGAILLLGVVVLLWGAAELGGSGGEKAGEPAPQLRAERYGGGTLGLEDLRGKVVMLDFWATWCPPCVEEMPTLVKLAREYEPRGLVFVAANRIEGDSRESVGRFLSTLPPLSSNAHVVFAGEEMIERFQISALPTLYLIDREGRILGVETGYASESRLRARLERALSP